MTTTTIQLKSDDPSPLDIEGVLVNVFDTGGAFQTSGSTDVDGVVVFDLPDDDYDLTFWKQSVSIVAGMPLRITVDVADSDNPPNTWEVTGHVTTMPESVDPLLCMVSGYVRGAGGLPTMDGKLTFAPTLETGVIGGNLIAPQHLIHIKPDEDGYYEFELLRNVSYNAYFHFLSDLLGKVPPALDPAQVPDLPAIDIVDLLFPVPVAAEFDPEVLAIDVGDVDASVSFTISYSDGSTRLVSPTLISINPTSDDEDVAQVDLLPGGVVEVTGVASGTANITIERTISPTIYYDPVPAFTTETLVVTVS